MLYSSTPIISSTIAWYSPFPGYDLRCGNFLAEARAVLSAQPTNLASGWGQGPAHEALVDVPAATTGVANGSRVYHEESPLIYHGAILLVLEFMARR